MNKNLSTIAAKNLSTTVIVVSGFSNRIRTASISDESNISLVLGHALLPHTVNDGVECREFPELGLRNYKCQDSSFCLAQDQMCDGIHDCRDGSDEGKFCDKCKFLY